MGRAKALGDFIKHGESVAVIELELKGRDANKTIKRVLEREGEGKCSSRWSINGNLHQLGSSSTESEVQRLVYGMNIQIDNLW